MQAVMRAYLANQADCAGGLAMHAVGAPVHAFLFESFLEGTIAACFTERVPAVDAVRLLLLCVGWVVTPSTFVAKRPHETYVTLAPYSKIVIECDSG